VRQIILKYSEKKITGSLALPGSKSISNRMLIIRTLSGNRLDFNELSNSDDTRLLKYYLEQTDICASSGIPMVIDTANAGTVLRFLLAYLSLKEGTWLLTGSDRMKQRPVEGLVSALHELGAKITYTEKNSFPPLRIIGSDIEGGNVDVDVSTSSQFVTALMLIAPYLEKGLQIRLLKNPVSFSYIEMTQKLMQKSGVRVEAQKSKIVIKPGKYQVKTFRVEPDWSAAAFWYETVALSENADIFLSGLSKESIQGDRVVADLFEELGVITHFEESGIRLTGHAGFASSFSYDFSSCPDLVPAVLATCAGLGIPAQVKGVRHLKYKESDRMLCMKTELQKTGCELKRKGNPYEMIPSDEKLTQVDCTFNTHNDHRIAMALAPLILKLGSVKINKPEVVDKSYPSFWDDLTRFGILSEEL
jgi:3-phosphoshikimate 1-carboxyvinyltransferase